MQHSSVQSSDCSTSNTTGKGTSTSNRSTTYSNVSSFVSYVTSCGAYQHTCGYNANANVTSTTTMRRASVSRRSAKLQSPPIRSRSSERFTSSSDSEALSAARLDFEEKNDNVNDFDNTKPQKLQLHQRAMSDPFDTQQQDAISTVGSEEDGATADSSTSSNIIIPTLPRFPVAETRNKNCWSTPPIEIFSVRGAGYFTDKKKVASAPYILTPRGSDLFLTDSNKHVALDQMTHVILGGQLRKKPTLAINFRFPWGYMNLYFELPKKIAVYMQKEPPKNIDPTLSVAEKTLVKWLLGDTAYKNERLKLIPYVAEGPWVVRKMVTGLPAIIGKKLPVSYSLNNSKHEEPVLTATLDIGNGSATAKRIVSLCRRYMSALTVDIGFLIQAEEEMELPEQMMGAIRVHGPDPLKAPKLN